MMRMRTVVAVLAVSLMAGGALGCAKREVGETTAAKAIKASAPAGTPLAKITPGMSDIDVRKVLGEPTRTRSYATGKRWIPWYFGSDTSRTAYTYAGQGEVVFNRNLKVLHVKYDPSVR